MPTRGRRHARWQVQRDPGWLLAVLAAALAACAPSPSDVARDRFAALAAGPDLAYRFELVATTDQNTSTAEGIVVGRDSAYTVVFDEELDIQPGQDFVHLGNRSFQRAAGGDWDVRERAGMEGGYEPPYLIRVFVGAALAGGGAVTFEGRLLHQLGTTQPIPIVVPGTATPSATVTRAEILVDDTGVPVRVVQELTVGDDADGRQTALLEARFFDVGTALTIDVPVVR
jgi:hypothetical protein